MSGSPAPICRPIPFTRIGNTYKSVANGSACAIRGIPPFKSNTRSCSFFLSFVSIFYLLFISTPFYLHAVPPVFLHRSVVSSLLFLYFPNSTGSRLQGLSMHLPCNKKGACDLCERSTNSLLLNTILLYFYCNNFFLLCQYFIKNIYTKHLYRLFTSAY